MLVSALAGGLMGIAVMGVDAELYRGIYRKPFSLISPSPLGWVLPLVGMLIAMAVGLAGAPAAVRIFGEERPVYWRESAANHNRSAYYVGKSISVIYRMLITALHFTSIFYVLAKPVAAFDKVYGIVTVLFYCVYGLSTIISMCVRRENASLVAVVACLFAGTFCGFGPTLVDAKRWHLDWFWELSYAKHCTEALYNLEVGSYANVYDLEETSKFYGYAIGDVLAKNVCLALLIGTILRLVSFMMMIFLNRDKQR
jgi:hypothetical protein